MNSQKVFLDDIYDNDFDELLEHLKLGKGSVFARAWSHLFSSSYRQAKHIFMLSWIGDFKPTGQAMLAFSEKAFSLKSQWQQLRKDQLPYAIETCRRERFFCKRICLHLDYFQKRYCEGADFFSMNLKIYFSSFKRYGSS